MYPPGFAVYITLGIGKEPLRPSAMSKTKVILAYPYSGALYRYFRDQLDTSSSSGILGHPYYRTLYGSQAHKYIELALNFLLLYDEVHITPADNHWPRSKLNPDSHGEVTELALFADWEHSRKGDYSEAQRYVGYLCDHPKVQALLGTIQNIPQQHWRQIINQALFEASKSAQSRIPILCSPGRRALISTLVEIQAPSLHPLFSNQNEVKFVDEYRELTGFAIMPSSLDDLMDIKHDKELRTYGSAFIKAAGEHRGVAQVTKQAVAKAALEAMETEIVSKRFVGALDWATSFLRLIQQPVLAMGSLGARHLASLGAEDAGWYEFKGKVDAAKSRAQLIRQLRAVAEADA
jgi:hypothetical protein